MLMPVLGMMSSALTMALFQQQPAQAASADLSTYEPMAALSGKDYGKPRTVYPDYIKTPSGLQYKDLREGTGVSPQPGDTCVISWEGYTIGYYGRPFEKASGPKGSSFAEPQEPYRFKLASGQVIPAVEEAVAGMKLGGIRRIVVPTELGWNEGGAWRKLGPPPSTFSGQRALDFVLSDRNGMIDKTLLITVELKNVQPGQARG